MSLRVLTHQTSVGPVSVALIFDVCPAWLALVDFVDDESSAKPAGERNLSNWLFSSANQCMRTEREVMQANK